MHCCLLVGVLFVELAGHASLHFRRESWEEGGDLAKSAYVVSAPDAPCTVTLCTCLFPCAQYSLHGPLEAPD